MRLIPLDSLKIGSVLAADIYNSTGATMFAKGEKVTSKMLYQLKHNHIHNIYITDKYCSGDRELFFTSQLYNLSIVFPEIEKFAKLSIEGTVRPSNLNDLIAVSEQLVWELFKYQNKLKIRYLPEKILSDSLVETTMNIAINSAILAIKVGMTRDETLNVFITALIKDIALMSPHLKGRGHYNAHPVVAYEYLKNNYELPVSVLLAVLHHHETCDGLGFPQGLLGNSISPYAKIVQIVEMFYELKVYYSKNAVLKFDVKEKLASKHVKCHPIYMEVFLANLEFFSTNVMFELNTGDIVTVVKKDSKSALFPRVKILQNKSNIYKEGALIDLDSAYGIEVVSEVYYAE